MARIIKKTTQAIIWSAVDVFLRFGLQFLLSVFFARLLSPEDFGMIAALFLFTSLSNLFVDSGFGSAIIQHQDVSHTDESTVFFFNLGMAALMALLLCAVAPFIAVFFEQPLLRKLTYIMALSVFVSAFGSIHNAVLTKNLMFKNIMTANVTSSALSGGLSLFLAFHGYGVWSLAWQILAASIINVMLLWYLHDWRPSLVFSMDSLRKLFRFGGFLFISSFLEVLYTGVYTLLIGKLFSVIDLGFYSRALNSKLLPSNFLDSIFIRVAFPVFSTAAPNSQHLVNAMKATLSVMMLINVPVMLGLAVIAEPFTLLLFGEKWLPSVPILQVLCLSAVLGPLNTVNLNALMARGYSDLFFRIEVFKKIIGIVLTAYASFHGVIAIAWAQVLISFIVFFINSYYTGHLLGYSSMQQLRDVSPSLSVGLLMVGVTWFMDEHIQFPPLTELLLTIAAGAAFYSIISLCIIKYSKSHYILTVFHPET